MPNSKADYDRARRAAKRVGLIASRSNWRRDSMDNYGGFRITVPYSNMCLYGDRYELSAEQVIEICKDYG